MKNTKQAIELAKFGIFTILLTLIFTLFLGLRYSFSGGSEEFVFVLIYGSVLLVILPGIAAISLAKGLMALKYERSKEHNSTLLSIVIGDIILLLLFSLVITVLALT